MPEFESYFVETEDDVALHVKTAGNPDNPAIILLHGFPEFWKGWYDVALRLLDEDYYVVLPDQRGYNTSSTPFWTWEYTVDKLASDVIALIDWIGKEKVILAGHDWGAAVAWGVISAYPDRIEKCVIVNVPHGLAFKKHLKKPQQLKKSWYMFAFQLPVIPQIMMRLFNFKMLRNAIRKSALPETFTDKQMQEYTKAWSHSGVGPMINWYRAAFRHKTKIRYDPIDLPVLIIWGRKDKFLSEELAELSMKYCNNGQVQYIDEATHWVLHEVPDEVAQYILDFIEN